MCQTVFSSPPNKGEVLKYDTNKHMFMQRGEIMIPIVLDMVIKSSMCNRSIVDERLAKMFNYHANNYYMGNRLKTTNVKVSSINDAHDIESSTDNWMNKRNVKDYRSYES
jgi:hypothetical protein